MDSVDEMIENTFAIEVCDLVKRFGEVMAVENITFGVNSGEVFGFLGPNGAGKTTTIHMLTGLARPDSGTIRIRGIDCIQRPRSVQHLIGVVPDESNLYPELTGFENLCFCAALYGIRKSKRITRARKLLDTFDLSKAADRKFGGYSKGMKRKLTIAAGIIHEPEILFLDEPTTGIDIASARQIRQLIANLHGNGTTIFLTTHTIEEAERLCDRIAFIVSGRIVKTDSVFNLIQPVQGKQAILLTLANTISDRKVLLDKAFPGLDVTQTGPKMIRIESDETIRVGPLVRYLEDQGTEVEEVRKLRPSLEDIFVRITGIETAAMLREKDKTGGLK